MDLWAHCYFCASPDCLWAYFWLVLWLCFPTFSADSDNQNNKENRMNCLHFPIHWAKPVWAQDIPSLPSELPAFLVSVCLIIFKYFRKNIWHLPELWYCLDVWFFRVRPERQDLDSGKHQNPWTCRALYLWGTIWSHIFCTVFKKMLVLMKTEGKKISVHATIGKSRMWNILS